MNDGFQLTNIFILIIKTSIKLLGFYLFIYLFFMTILSNYFQPVFFVCFFCSLFFCFLFFVFCANYCVFVTTNISRCCGWLRFAALPKLLFFYSWHPDVCTAMIINNNNNNKPKPFIDNKANYKILFTINFT